MASAAAIARSGSRNPPPVSEAGELGPAVDVGVAAGGAVGDSVAAALADIPEVDYVVICAGGYDMLAELVCTDDDHLLKLLNDVIRAIPGVTTTETFVYLKLAKQTYAWGTR